MKKIIVLGDKSNEAKWHPLSNMDPLLNILEKEYELTVTSNYSELTSAELNSYDICINYIDNWQERGSLQTQQAICEYIYGGGKMLTLHNGIITKNSPDLLQLHGGSFIGHEEYCQLQYRLSEKVDEVMFSLHEEPYQYVLDNPEGLELFLEYYYKGNWYPAGWKVFRGAGRIVYLEPGHDRNTFSSSDYIKLIRKTLEYLLGDF